MPTYNIDFIPLASAIIGGLIAVVPSTFIEKHKRKKEKSIKGSYDVLIPLAKEIEELFQKKFFEERIDEEIFSFYSTFQFLEKYLNVDKKIFLNNKIKEKIKSILDQTTEIDNQLTKEYDKIILEYKNFTIEKLNKFRVGEYSIIDFIPSTKSFLKKCIMTKRRCILLSKINCFEVVYYEEFLEKRKSDKIHIDEEERTVYGAIKYGQCDENDLNSDSYELLDFLEKNIDTKEEEAEIFNLIKDTKTFEKIEFFFEEIGSIKKLIEKAIVLE